MSVGTPYRFVPLSPLVLLPDWAPRVSHDHPFADGVCGELRLTLRCHTPLCVGGSQTKSADDKPGEVLFYRAPDHQLAIPGTSLKGMLRNVLEIVSFARFKQVEDQRLGVRDISQSKNFYTEAITRVPAKTGWLRFADGQWSIVPCEYSRLHQQLLIDWLKVGAGRWKATKTAKERYDLIGLLPPVKFNTEPHKTKKRIAIPDAAGRFDGVIVVTGQPGKPFDADKHSKKYEFVFHDPEPGRPSPAALPVDDRVMRGFQHIHDASVEWRFWRSKLTTGELKRGIPVFFHTDDERKVRSLGLAFMYKLPYAYTLHEAIAHTHEAHLGGGAPDLPDLLFGRIDEQEKDGQRGRGGARGADSLRGRVAFGLGRLQEDATTQWQGPTVLSSPKPTFYPAYIRQDNDRAFHQLMESKSQLSGWKRYPVHPAAVAPPPPKSGAKSQIKLETVPPGAAFQFTLRVHNLRRVELGALLWALDFGGRPELRHGLGLGKPFGLGQVSLTLDGWDLQPNDPDSALATSDLAWLAACREEFNGLMEQFFDNAGIGGPWDESDPIKALLEYATPAGTTDGFEYLPEPKAYQRLKRTERLPELRKALHAHGPAKPRPGFDFTQPQSFISPAELRRAEQEAARRAAEERAAREAQRAAMSPAERAIADCLAERTDPNLKEIPALMTALKKGRWEGDLQREVAVRVRDMMRADGYWKETTQAKKPEKDRDYQNTLLVARLAGGK